MGLVHMSEILLDYGANLFCHNNSKCTPLDEAFKAFKENNFDGNYQKLINMLDKFHEDTTSYKKVLSVN